MSERESSLGWQLVRNLEQQSDLKRVFKADMDELKEAQSALMGQIKSAQTAFDFARDDAALIDTAIDDAVDAVNGGALDRDGMTVSATKGHRRARDESRE